MTDLDELFARDPLKLSDQDLDIIIAKVRSQFAQFDLTGKSPAKPKKVKKSLDETLKAAKPATIDLSELGLD